MKITIFSSIVLLTTLLLTLGSPVHAHKIRTFAYESGGQIITETVFNSGRPAKGAIIKVMTTADDLVLSGKTDENGIFSFAIPQKAQEQQLDLNIIADVGEGHRGSWLLSAADYLAEVAVEETPAAESIKQTATHPNNREPEDSKICMELEQRLEQLIISEISPIKRELAEQQTQNVGLKDILSGLGYIFGLAGIILYYQSKKTRSQK